MSKRSRNGLILALLLSLSLIVGAVLIFRKRKEKTLKGFFEDTEYSEIAPLIEAQARHETGNFTSKVYLEQNNPFGMKHAVKRPQLGVNDGRTHRTYKDLNEAYEDYLIYLKYVNFPKYDGLQDFVKSLKDRSYFTDSMTNYLLGVQRWYNKYN